MSQGMSRFRVMTILLNFETPAPIDRVMHATMRGPQRQYALQYA